jgi:formate hydrogenlyase subunit 3/multisubunit Na+/H+ antiporter MnhD subunit
MTLATLVLVLHGDNPRLELLYFWAAVMLALTPILIFGGIGVWVVRKMWKEREEESAERGVRSAELKG